MFVSIQFFETFLEFCNAGSTPVAQFKCVQICRVRHVARYNIWMKICIVSHTNKKPNFVSTSKENIFKGGWFGQGIAGQMRVACKTGDPKMYGWKLDLKGRLHTYHISYFMQLFKVFHEKQCEMRKHSFTHISLFS